MAKVKFDWAKLPKHMHASVIDLVAQTKTKELLKIHDHFKLSGYDYGCCGASGMYVHFRAAISKGIISKD